MHYDNEYLSLNCHENKVTMHYNQ